MRPPRDRNTIRAIRRKPVEQRHRLRRPWLDVYTRTMAKRTHPYCLLASLVALLGTACSGKESPAVTADAGGAGGGGGFEAGSGDPCAANPMCDTRAIASGNLFSCALSGDGKVKCWGDNYRGKLGLGDTMARG